MAGEMRRGVVVVAIALLCSAPLVARADDGLTFTGNAWVSATFDATTGATAAFEMSGATRGTTVRAAGLWITDPNGDVSRFLWTATGGGTSLLVRSSSLGLDVAPTIDLGAGGSLALSVSMSELQGGTHRIICVLATDGAPGAGAASWSGDGATLTAMTHGDEVFIATGERFQAQTAIGASVVGAHALVMDGAHLDRTMDGALYGWFAANGPGVEVHYRGPGLSGAGESSYPFTASPAGVYRFEASGVGDVFAWGASVP